MSLFCTSRLFSLTRFCSALIVLGLSHITVAHAAPSVFAPASFEPSISPFDAESFRRLVDFRVGSGEEKYFYTFGDVRAQPGGEVIFEYEGVEVCRQDVGSSTPHSVTQISRRIFFYKNKQTGEYIRSFENTPVAPVSYPYLIMNWNLGDNGKVQIKGTQGQVPRVVSMNIDIPTVRRLPQNVLHFPVNLFFQAGSYSFHEVGNYISDPNRSAGESFESGHFVRLQPMPSWAAQKFSAKDVLLDLSVVNVNSFSALPERLKRIISEEFPLFAKPPKDLDECMRIQQGQQ
jgi:hypothetical protein